MKFILGKKQYMTQVFDENDRVHPATVISVAPNVVVQVRTKERDGYEAVQVGCGTRAARRVSRSEYGIMKPALQAVGAGENEAFESLREFRARGGAVLPEKQVGEQITVDEFQEGELVTISAVSKGKGFQGVVKRHDFGGGRRSHGNKHHERAPGAIGATGPQRVLKGTKMAGRMGGDRTTIRNLKVLQVDNEDHQLVIEGAVPGRRGTLVEIKGQE